MTLFVRWHIFTQVWGDYFIRSVAPLDMNRHACMQQRVEKLKEEVRQMFVRNALDHHLEEDLNLVDTLQRLGLAYHFEKEINEALAHIHDARLDSEDLYVVSLRFRLLRQKGYNIPSGN
uniref:(-)-germacrene D synthase n=1 Tax=Anthurium amnicola TaxID=1678845 RepID=A0A1D1XHC8_9ARAE